MGHGSRCAVLARHLCASVVELDLFILQSEFPKQEVTLRIFEPRYVTMVKDCVDKRVAFGIVAPASAEGGSKTEPALVGTEVAISECEATPDGGYVIKCRSKRRFRVCSTTRQRSEQLSARAFVQYFDDINSGDELVQGLEQDARDAFASLHHNSVRSVERWRKAKRQGSSGNGKGSPKPLALFIAARVIYADELVGNAELELDEWTWSCLAAMPLDARQRLRALRMLTVAARLQLLARAARRSEAVLREDAQKNEMDVAPSEQQRGNPNARLPVIVGEIEEEVVD